MNTSNEPNATGAGNPVGNNAVIDDPVHNPENVPIDKVPEGYRFGRQSEVDNFYTKGSLLWSNGGWRTDTWPGAYAGCVHKNDATFIVPITPAEYDQQPRTLAREFWIFPESFQEFMERKALEEQLEESQQENRMLRAQVEELKKQLAACQWRPVTEKPRLEECYKNGDVCLATTAGVCAVYWSASGWNNPPANWLAWLPFPHHLLPKQETPEEKERREFEAYLATLPEPSVHREVWKEDHWNTWQAARAGKVAQS